MSVYRLPSPYERAPVSRRLSGFGLALAINLALLLILMTLGVIPPPVQKDNGRLVVDLVPEGRRASQEQPEKSPTRQPRVVTNKPIPPQPPIVLPTKPTITIPPRPKEHTQPWLEMSSADMASADISKLPGSGSGTDGDSEAVGRGPHGEVLYAAEWARHPTSAELGGYLPPNPPDGWGLIACKTMPENRVDDCVELDQYPHGSHLASAVRQAAWQFRVRPPRKNGRPMVGEWVSIRIDYTFSGRGGL